MLQGVILALVACEAALLVLLRLGEGKAAASEILDHYDHSLRGVRDSRANSSKRMFDDLPIAEPEHADHH